MGRWDRTMKQLFGIKPQGFVHWPGDTSLSLPERQIMGGRSRRFKAWRAGGTVPAPATNPGGYPTRNR